MFLLKGSTIGTSVIPTTSLATGKWSIMDAYAYSRLSSWPLMQNYPTSVNYLVVAGGGGGGSKTCNQGTITGTTTTSQGNCYCYSCNGSSGYHNYNCQNQHVRNHYDTDGWGGAAWGNNGVGSNPSGVSNSSMGYILIYK